MDTKENLIDSLEKIQGKKILVLGDIMLDHYQWGDVSRISPEAPVPVVYVERETYSLGGAGNVARNIKSLGGEPILLGTVGNDLHGERVSEILKSEGIDSDIVVSNQRKTTIKTRVIGNSQQIARVDIENNSNLNRKDDDKILEKLRKNDIGEYILISDYGKGLIRKKTLSFIKNKKIVLDPKDKNFKDYKNIYIMTPNQKEAEEGSGIKIRNEQDVIKAGKRLKHAKGLKNLLITLGPKGMILFSEDENITHFPTSARNVYDVTGAGDTVIAAMGICLEAGLTLQKACILANYAAGVVVGQVGTATADKKSITQALKLQNHININHW